MLCVVFNTAGTALIVLTAGMLHLSVAMCDTSCTAVCPSCKSCPDKRTSWQVCVTQTPLTVAWAHSLCKLEADCLCEPWARRTASCRQCMQDATTDTATPKGDCKAVPGSCDTIAFAAKRSQDQFSRSKRQQQEIPPCSQGSG